MHIFQKITFISTHYVHFHICVFFHVTSILKHHILKQKQSVKEMSKGFEIYETKRKSADKTTFL